MINNAKCGTCGKAIHKAPSQMKGRMKVFCCNACRIEWMREYTRKFVNVKGHGKGHKNPKLSEYNKTQNPLNRSEGWTQEKREQSRARELAKHGNIYKHDTYKKLYGTHEHRIVAEQKIGRPLRSDEVVHHIDCNRQNNDPDNLIVITRAEHARLHFLKKQK